MTRKCRFCRNARVLLLSVLMGSAAGFAVLELGGSTNLSMIATFFGAVAPLMWHVRRSRTG